MKIEDTNSYKLATHLYNVAREDNNIEFTLSERALLSDAGEKIDNIVETILREALAEGDEKSKVDRRIRNIESAIKKSLNEEELLSITEFNAYEVEFKENSDLLDIKTLNDSFFSSKIVIPIPEKGKKLRAHGIPVTRLGFMLHDFIHGIKTMPVSGFELPLEEFQIHFSRLASTENMLKVGHSEKSTGVTYLEEIMKKFKEHSAFTCRAINLIRKKILDDAEVEQNKKNRLELGLFYIFHENFTSMSQFSTLGGWSTSTLQTQLESVIKKETNVDNSQKSLSAFDRFPTNRENKVDKSKLEQYVFTSENTKIVAAFNEFLETQEMTATDKGGKILVTTVNKRFINKPKFVLTDYALTLSSQLAKEISPNGAYRAIDYISSPSDFYYFNNLEEAAELFTEMGQDSSSFDPKKNPEKDLDTLLPNYEQEISSLTISTLNHILETLRAAVIQREDRSSLMAELSQLEADSKILWRDFDQEMIDFLGKCNELA
jgi:hypothetical protein